MQLNAGLERLDGIRVGDETEDNEVQKMTTATANKFILYSILDEFQFNDSTMPKVMNGGDNIARERGYIGTGFISHIENEMIGLVYIVDAGRAPDTTLFFGSNPNQLAHLPEPGEMFGLLWNEKYLVRAVRIEYESGVDVIQKRQYSAWLMDIGCTVRIDITPTLRDHYEVTEVAKTIPAYAKHFQLAQIPDRTTIYDLLHVRIQYEVLFIENDLGFVNVRRAGANPFAIDQQNEWNFFMYYFGKAHMNAFSSHRVKKQASQPRPPAPAPAPLPPKIAKIEQATTVAAAAVPVAVPTKAIAVAKRSPSKQSLGEYPKNTNPFLNGSYKIESIPMESAINTKANPFYSDSMENLYETSQIKQKFVNLKLNKVLNIEVKHNLQSNKVEHSTRHTTSEQHQISAKHQPIDENKILNGDALAFNDVIEMKIHLNQSAQHGTKAKATDGQRQNHDNVEKPTVNGDVHVQPKQQQTSKPQQIKQQQSPVSNDDLKINNYDDDNNNYNSSSSIKSLKQNNTIEKEPIKLCDPVKLANQKPTRCNGNVNMVSSTKGFPQPKKLPQVGDTIKILFQVLENVEVFYATVVNDPERTMAVHEFSTLLNHPKNKQHFKQYGTASDCFSQPKLFDKVLAKYDDECYYRAQVIGVVDDHAFHVFYVDFGNCAKVKTTQLFKYDNKWDREPAYALRFRLNGIEELQPWDYEAEQTLQQLLNGDCDATIVRIQYCEKTKRSTYVVDLYDENGLNVADTMVEKNRAIYTEDRRRPKKQPKAENGMM